MVRSAEYATNAPVPLLGSKTTAPAKSNKAKIAWLVIGSLVVLFTLMPSHIHHSFSEHIIYSLGELLLVFLLYLIVEIGFFGDWAND